MEHVTNQEVYNYIYRYPTDELSLNAFRNIDKKNFSAENNEEWEECKQFIDKHLPYALCPQLYVRHPLYALSPASIAGRRQYCVLDFKTENDKIILLGDTIYNGSDMSKQLIDYIISPEGELILGRKHFWLTVEAGLTFVHGAGRAIIAQDGEISYIDNHSGHFQPDLSKFRKSLKTLSHLKIREINEWNYENI